MARIFKEEEFNAKRNEILDFSLGLVYSKGYAQMTIQDILDGLHISRGALYHYFDSKETLLEALVNRMGKAAVETFLPILQDPHLTAIQKFRRYFEASAQWKSSGKAVILGMLRTWYTDDNTIVRQKMSAQSIKGTASILEPIIRQGMQEGVFSTRYPEQVAETIAGIAYGMADSMVGLMVADETAPVTLQKLETLLEAYFDTVERILGAPAGSLKAFDASAFEEWLEVA
jgi:TetR/AcrR family transcriptional regulator, transcriptional repressor for nem operon